MIEKEFVIEKQNGQKIAGKAYIPDDLNVYLNKYPALIFSHGFNGNFKGLMHHGNGYAEQGIICVFFDFCGGGIESLSDGKLNEMTVFSEIEDLNTVIDYVKKLEYVDADNLFLQGESMGGFVSAYVAAHRLSDVKGLVLWYPAFVIPEDSKRRYKEGNSTCFGLELSPDFNKIAMNIDIYLEISSYKNPVIIIHGNMDEIVPISYSEKAIETYSNSKVVVIDGAGHGFNGADSVKAREETIKFVKHILALSSI